MEEAKIEYPDWFDELAQFEHESKGYLNGVVVHTSNGSQELSFYDPVRLNQDIQSEFEVGSCFSEKNLIVIPLVNKENIEKAIERLF